MRTKAIYEEGVLKLKSYKEGMVEGFLKSAGIEKGDEVLVLVRDSKVVVEKNPLKRLRGILKNIPNNLNKEYYEEVFD